ncbi:1A family penicillin-binding protein [Symbiobacterium terraclitae]|uniref:Penicillin-binding protein 1A n=1 Tax=Symbiobacterium terraclitae TaxID=557451 RepID=A0ABS4JRK5_9FIRM|nr:1A family penicillin-binding protein [Symbiobacterium terraclitae]
MSHPTDGTDRRQTDRPSGRASRRRWLRRGVQAACAAAAAWLLFCTGSALLAFASLPMGELAPGRPSIVYAADGSAVGPLTGPYQEPVALADLPPYVAQAFVASEDIRFYQHRGVDLRGIARALVTDLREGTVAEGGSTITQQVARNTFLSQHQTLTRKVREAVLALLLEVRFEKDEILALYLNQLYMGHGTYGVGTASRLYFNKRAADLTPGEAAALAGIAPAPELFSPLRDPEAARLRRDAVLDRMVAAGYLAPEQAEAEKAQPLHVAQGELDAVRPHPWYLEEVRAELRSRYRLDAEQVALMGLAIHTGLDPAMQEAAEGVLAARIFPAHTPDGVEAAFAAVDPRTGEVRALVGGRNYPPGGGLNRASRGRVSPGSVLKPVVVYAPAVEYAGLTPDSIVLDEPLNVGGWEPQNWDHQFRGEVTLREAARLSLNIPAVRLLEQVGLERARAFAQGLGIPVTAEDRDLTLALGSMAEGASPLELAGAYQPFANGGVYRTPHLITRVETADGRLLRGRPVAVRQAMRPQTAHAVTDMLQTVVRQGTGTGALLDRPMAGKTGTVELPPGEAFQGLSGNAAAWFVGYTPDVAASVWVGYDQVDAEHYLPPEVNGSTYPTWIWRQVVGAALAGRPALAFPGPEGGPPRVVETPAPPAEEPAEPPPAEEPARPVLPAIVDLAASPGPQPGSVNLTWRTEGGEPAGGQVRFRVLRSAGADGAEAEVVATVDAPPFLDVLSQPGTYDYQVVAVDPATGTTGEPSAPLRVEVRMDEPEPGQEPPEPGDGGPEEPGDGETGAGEPGDGDTDDEGPDDGSPVGGDPGEGAPDDRDRDPDQSGHGADGPGEDGRDAGDWDEGLP